MQTMRSAGVKKPFEITFAKLVPSSGEKNIKIAPNLVPEFSILP